MKKIALCFATVAAAFTFAGCGVETEPGEVQKDPEKHAMYSEIVPLPNGGSVICVYTGSFRGGVTCDWTNATQD